MMNVPKHPRKKYFQKKLTCLTMSPLHIAWHHSWCISHQVTSFTSWFLFNFLQNFKKHSIFYSKHFFPLFNITSLKMWSDVMKCLVIGTNLFKIINKIIICPIMIVICFVIQSFITIFLNNSLSLLEKLESKYDKISSINGKWNEPSKK